MIGHIAKLIWNRKRRNFITSLGIFISFIILFLVMVMQIKTIQNFFTPKGYNTEDIRYVTFEWHDANMAEVNEVLMQVSNLIKVQSEVKDQAFSRAYIYSPSVTSNGRFSYDGHENSCHIAWGDLNLASTLEIKPILGRWFNETDPLDPVEEPAVITQTMAEEFFGEEDPVGKIILRQDNRYKVIGVIDQFRSGSRFSDSRRVLFRRMITSEKHYTNLDEAMGLRLLLKTKPGTTADFEMRLIKQLNRIAHNWSFNVSVLDNLKSSASLQSLVFPIILGIISIFMLVNVGLGMFGVIWYQIDKRKGEVGLRRALGSPVRSIYRQIIGESMMLTTFSIIWGTVFAVQFPMLSIFNEVTPQLYFKAYLISVAIIYLLTFICAFYPSLQATRIQPAEALHYE